MKKFFKIVLLISIVSLTFFCQSEIDETIGEDPDAVITSGSEMAMWIQRGTGNRGSVDDFLDDYSCGTVKLPVAVELNGAIRMINNENDLSIVQRIMEELGISATFQFPITMITGDYSEVQVNSEEHLNVLRRICSESSDGRIECFDFQYPVEVLTYNANNQSNGSVIIEDDRSFYLFIEELGNLYASISFPVEVKFSTGEELQINTNGELTEAIREAERLCRAG